MTKCTFNTQPRGIVPLVPCRFFYLLLIDATPPLQMFDGNVNSDKAFRFKVGKGKVIKVSCTA